MPEHKALQAQTDPILKMLAGSMKAVKSVLPQHLTPERMLRISHQVISRSPKLRKCTPVSLINGLIEGSKLGLEFGRTCHLIPFGNIAVFDPDYKGLIELGYRSGKVKLWRGRAIYANDEFDYNDGTSYFIAHKRILGKDRGELIGAFSHVILTDGTEDFLIIDRSEAMAAKAKSAGAKSKDSPWNGDNEWQMWIKTAVRLHAKFVPSSSELQQATMLADQAASGTAQTMDNVTEAIDAEFKSVGDMPKEPDDQKSQVQAKLDALNGKKNENKTKPVPPPPTIDEVPQPTKKQPDFDPVTSPLQKRYGADKRAQIMAELESRGLQFNPAWSGLQLHNLIINDIPGNDEPETPPEPSTSDPDAVFEDQVKRLEQANEIFKKRQKNSYNIWKEAVTGTVNAPELGLADLDEADKFEARFLEIIEGG